MAKHYEVFYCLEKPIRQMISDVLETAHGVNWWVQGIIPDNVLQDVDENVKKGMRFRDYSKIIKTN